MIIFYNFYVFCCWFALYSFNQLNQLPFLLPFRSSDNSLSTEDRSRLGRLNIITDCRVVTRRHADLYRPKNPKSEGENIPRWDLSHNFSILPGLFIVYIFNYLNQSHGPAVRMSAELWEPDCNNLYNILFTTPCGDHRHEGLHKGCVSIMAIRELAFWCELSLKCYKQAFSTRMHNHWTFYNTSHLD